MIYRAQSHLASVSMRSHPAMLGIFCAICLAIGLLSAPTANADWVQRVFQFNGLTFASATTSTVDVNGADGRAQQAEATPRFRLAMPRLFGEPKPTLDLLVNDLADQSPKIDSQALSVTYDSLLLEPNNSSIPVTSRLKVPSGGSLLAILQSFGINASERRFAANKIDSEFSLTKLQAGWEIQVGYDASIPDGETGRLLKVAFNPSSFETVSLQRNSSLDDFTLTSERDEIATVNIRYNGTIEDGLWLDLQRVGFSDKMIGKVQNVLGKRLNVNRDIQAGARYEVIMEASIRENGQIKASGGVLYASMEVGDLSQQDTQDLTKEVYFFEPPRARAGYFQPSGKSLTRGVTFLRRPTRGRISSHFNPRRKNPVTGQIRPHNGVDIAAPRGTPIVAAADGQIVQRKTNGGYGKFIEIDHGGGWKTRYAHMNSYSSKFKRWSRVRQGDTIGFVGTTGSSTGNHLHYEILKNGVARDPIRSSLPESVTLSGADKTAFNRYKNEIAALKRDALLFGEDVYVNPPQ